LSEEHRLRVFDNRLLRRVFGPKRDEVTVEWRRLHNKELYDLRSLSNIIRVIKSRRMGFAGYVARMVEKRGAYGILIGKHKGMKPLGRQGNVRGCYWISVWKVWSGLIWLTIGTSGPLSAR
jgi:hypothetical protein